jgi:hypothetical protein
VLGEWPSPPPAEAGEVIVEVVEVEEDVEPVPLPPPIAVQPVHDDIDEMVGVLARYSLDPLAEQAQKRRFGRHHEENGSTIEVPARPGGRRGLPGSLTA